MSGPSLSSSLASPGSSGLSLTTSPSPSNPQTFSSPARPSPAPLSSPSFDSSFSSSWDDYRKSARKLESSIYSHLCEFSQAANSRTARPSGALASANSSDSETSHLLSASASSSLPVLERDIEGLLASLAEVNEEMGKFLTGNSEASGAAGAGGFQDSQAYTLQRYKAIWHDYSQEFRKTKETIKAARIRAELLAHSSHAGNSGNLRTRADPLMREKEKLHHSMRMTDDLVGQAADSKDSLHNQGALLKNFTNKAALLMQRFPVVNQLMNRIRLTKNRDSLIIAAFIAGLMLFSLVYWMSKP